jgi:hypothetical protein
VWLLPGRQALRRGLKRYDLAGHWLACAPIKHAIGCAGILFCCGLILADTSAEDALDSEDEHAWDDALVLAAPEALVPASFGAGNAQVGCVAS